MNIRLASIATLFFMMSACSSTPVPQPTTGTEASLAEASFAVSRSISSLSETAQAARPLPQLDPPPNPASYGMGGIVSLDWSGPVEPLVKQLADASNYRLRVLGNPPGIPVMVTVYAKNIILADALRDIGFQCGRRANIVVFPDSQVIELRYAKN